MGGEAGDLGSSVAVDGSGNVYVTGSKGRDTFVSKIDNAGNFVWTRQMAWIDFARSAGRDVAVDGNGNVYTTGSVKYTVDFDPGAGVFELTAAGDSDLFVSKLDSAGNFVWARRMGGTRFVSASGVAVDGSGNVYTTGSINGTADFDPGAGVFNLNSDGDRDIFVAKYTSAPSSGQSPSISEGGIVLATLLPTITTISPFSIISVFGQNFPTETIRFPNLDSEGNLDTILGGACLMMNSESLSIFAITPGQINAQASGAKALGPASFTVVTNCATAAPISSAPLAIEIGRFASPTPQALTSGVEIATVEEAAPGVFLFPPLADDGLIAARFNSDNAAVAPDDMFTDEFGTSRPAVLGDIIVLYGTGWGETTAALVTGELASGAAELLPEANAMVTFGGIPMDSEDVLYVGVTPTTAGLFQLAIRVPLGATPGNQSVILTVYGKSTPIGPVVPVVAP
jgi:uncharacterized protein (TIGR03437 family)